MLSTACETDHIGKVLQIRRHEHTLLKYTLRKHACKRTHVVTKDQRTVTAPHNQGLAALSGHGWEASGVPGPLELFSGWGCTWTQRRRGQRTHALRQRNGDHTRRPRRRTARAWQLSQGMDGRPVVWLGHWGCSRHEGDAWGAGADQ